LQNKDDRPSMEDILKSSVIASYHIEYLEYQSTRLRKGIVSFEKEALPSKKEGIYLILCINNFVFFCVIIIIQYLRGLHW
jgi:hypothetical protein